VSVTARKKANSKANAKTKSKTKNSETNKAASKPGATKPSTLRAGASQAAEEPKGHRIVRVDPPAFLWRGFHHRWQYNHRLNRLGSYVRHVGRGEQETATEGRVGHPAASGSGNDTATVRDLYSEIDATRVWFQPGRQEFKFEAKEGHAQSLNIPLDIELDPGLKHQDNYTVVINGFDLMAERDADKLSTFSLSITEPAVAPSGERLRFDIAAMLNVDCDTLECDTKIKPGHVAAAVAFPKLAFLPIGEALLGKLNLSTAYTLKVHYMIIAGADDELNLIEATEKEVSLAWDDKNELRRPQGDCVVKVTDDALWHDDDVTNTFAFRHLQIELEPTGNNRRLKNGAMHLLEWNMAIEEIHTSNTEVSAHMSMFFKNWAAGMWSVKPKAVFAHRDGGTAKLRAGLQLLQFKNLHHYEELQENRQLHWKPKNDQTAPSARNETVVIAGR
jgi:hypothetical protein